MVSKGTEYQIQRKEQDLLISHQFHYNLQYVHCVAFSSAAFTTRHYLQSILMDSVTVTWVEWVPEHNAIPQDLCSCLGTTHTWSRKDTKSWRYRRSLLQQWGHRQMFPLITNSTLHWTHKKGERKALFESLFAVLIGQRETLLHQHDGVLVR